MHKSHANDKELYDCNKGALSEDQLNEIYMEDFVQHRMVYTLEDFNSFAPIRLNYRPVKATTICLIFFKSPAQMD